MERKEVKVAKLSGFAVRNAEGRPNTAVLEIITSQGSQFFSIERSNIAKLIKALQESAELTKTDISTGETVN